MTQSFEEIKLLFLVFALGRYFTPANIYQIFTEFRIIVELVELLQIETRVIASVTKLLNF